MTDSDERYHVVAAHSQCGWCTKQKTELPSASKVITCDATPSHMACQETKAFPTHLMCSSAGCDIVDTGFKNRQDVDELIIRSRGG
jgi:hypothetical protein